jgi:GGDEF domain-containing protein
MDSSAKYCPPLPKETVPLFDATQLPVRGWCEGSREDPLTGLIAFPDFHSLLPREVSRILSSGGLVALAIGDVDGLKDHVEHSNANDLTCFGHLAGNRVMARLGDVTRKWFHQQSFMAGCAATFGGDEVIIAAAINDPTHFYGTLIRLRDELAVALPISVSFAFTVVAPEHLPPDQSGRGWKHVFTDRLLAGVDRCLFAHKAARRLGGDGGVIAVTDVPYSDAETATLAGLQSLPSGDEVLHAIARPVPDGPMLLPCLGPLGQRGRRFRVTSPSGSRTAVVISWRGQAALPASTWLGVGPVAVGLKPLRAVSAAGVPDDLGLALGSACLSWSVLPAHEQAQMLHLIRESSTLDIRRARIKAVLGAVASRSPRSS